MRKAIAPHRSTHANRRRLWLPLILVPLATTSCFEDPVEETLQLCFADADGVVIRLETAFHAGGDDENAAFEERIREEQRGYMEGTNAWHERFDRLLEPALDGAGWRRSEGRLERYRRWAGVEGGGRGLEDFFADLPVEVAYFPADDSSPEAELAFYPTGGDRASPYERSRLETGLRDFSRAAAIYYATTDELWSHLRSNPSRVRPALERLFDDLINGYIEEDRPEPPAREKRLVDAVIEAEESLLRIFEVDEKEAYTLQELSRKVFDPFPARTLVAVPGAIVEHAGFEVAEGGFGLPRTSLWDALAGLENLYVSPDPIVVRVSHLMADAQGFDLEDVIARGSFYSSTPPSHEIRNALLEELEPAAEYRLVWRPASRTEGETENETALACTQPSADWD